MVGASQSNTSGYDRHRRADQGLEQSDINAEAFREMLATAEEVLGKTSSASAAVVTNREAPSGFWKDEHESGKAATVAVTPPEFVTSDGRIDSNLLRAFLIDLSNREHTAFSPSRDFNYLSDAAMFPIVVWATGRQPKPGQSIEDYYTSNTNAEENLATLTIGAGNDFAEPFLKALEQLHVSSAKDRKIPVEPIKPGGENSQTLTVAEVVRLDPVNCCRFLLHKQSPNDGFGIYSVGQALLEFRGIMGLS